ncbi:MAG: sodium:alanine symporter family protein [Spirochaetales bacterium]|jgi:AGCS family alanine or glycine:cation symporter|nr:sodium:alanine symporter family protein [Spirochaetales bacterium]
MEFLTSAMEFLWGIPLMILMVGIGLFLTIRSGFFQFTHLRYIFRNTIGTMFGKHKKSLDGLEGNMTPFQAISAVLSGTVGSGNIAGVASAIAIGGPGSVFWMWVISFFGMLTKMVEVTLAVHFREKEEGGDFHGGPMYYIKKGLGKNWAWLAFIYAIALLILVITDATFVQPNTMASAINSTFGTPTLAVGIVAVVIMILVCVGGLGRIGRFCGFLAAPMCVIYVIGALGVVLFHLPQIPGMFALIFEYAFAPAPAMGGFVGSTVSMAMSRGASRGIFSNEAGMGTAATVHATAKTEHPVRQGMWGVMEVFIDTIIICNLTAFSILLSGVWTGPGQLTGAPLTFAAFETVWGMAGVYIACISVALFCFSSTLGWFVEFRTAVVYIFGEKSFTVLKWFYFVPPVIGAMMEIETIWTMADMATGFLVIPNVIALALLSPVFVKLFRDFKEKNPVSLK